MPPHRWSQSNRHSNTTVQRCAAVPLGAQPRVPTMIHMKWPTCFSTVELDPQWTWPLEIVMYRLTVGTCFFWQHFSNMSKNLWLIRPCSKIWEKSPWDFECPYSTYIFQSPKMSPGPTTQSHWGPQPSQPQSHLPNDALEGQRLVGGWPIPLKNDGVNVSWDDEIPKIWTNPLKSIKPL
jgi:hypothetical protein